MIKQLHLSFKQNPSPDSSENPLFFLRKKIKIVTNSWKKLLKITQKKSKYEMPKNKKILLMEDDILYFKKMASYLHRTAQPRTLAAFPPWGILQELVV